MRTSFCLWALCIAAACVTNPVTHNTELMLVSESKEIAMGRDIDSRLVAGRRVYEDSAWEGYVRTLGLHLAAASERPDLPWTFRVLDDTSMNAFAAPGGFVYVTRGMLVYLNSEAQLAAVLGHEIGHVTARHAAGQVTRRGIALVGLAVASAATSWPVGDAGAMGLGALFLQNSRHDEQQADDLGLRYMSDAGYDPLEMLAVLRMIERVDGGDSPRGWLATHPSPEHRIENVTQERFNLRSTGTLVERDAYVRRLDGLVFGIRPGRSRRRSNVKDNVLVVPERGYQLTFPDAWTFKTDSGTTRAESPAQDATIELTTVDQPDADSAARAFFTLRGKAGGPLTPARINDLAVVSAPVTLLPLALKTCGYVSFIEYQGSVYRVMGYANKKQWPAYRGMIEGAMRTFEAIPPADSLVPQIQPQRVAILPLREPTTIAALARARPSPVEATELAGINQVAPDSVLPAGQVIKWVVGAPVH